MKRLFAVLCSLALSLGICAAHMCLVNPRQRGTMYGLNQPGSPDCILLSPPCGGRAKENAKLTWGSQFEVIFQKNLNHWNQQNPGYFEVSLIGGSHNMSLTKLVDTGEPSLHIYSLTGQVPASITNGDYILQVVYKTNNNPAAFYQCADITVSK